MKFIRKYLILTSMIVAMLCYQSCISNENHTEKDLQQAEISLIHGNIADAARIAKHINERDTDTLTCRQLGRLSLIYMQLADSVDTDDNIGLATELCRRAFAMNVDSATLFYSSVSQQQTPYAIMLTAIVGALDSSMSSSSTDSDSLITDTASWTGRQN